MKNSLHSQMRNLLILIVLFFPPLTSQSLHAEVVCHSKNSSRQNVVRVYKRTCPKNSTALSAELLGANQLFATGAPGPQGSQGTTGVPGLQGPRGDSGPIGDTGMQGPAGVQGAQGPQGIPGATGPVGDSGPAGLSASDLFYFTGGTGSMLLGSVGDQQVYPINQTGGPTSDVTSGTDLMIPTGSRCSAIVFIATLDVAPGAGNFWQFALVNGNYASMGTQVPLCSFTAGAKSCSFTQQLSNPLTAETSIALLASKLSTSPPSTSARWSIRCTAP